MPRTFLFTSYRNQLCIPRETGADPAESDRVIESEIATGRDTVRRARKKTTVTNVTVDKRTQHKGPERDGEFLPGPLRLRSSAWTGLGAVIPDETPASRI